MLMTRTIARFLRTASPSAAGELGRDLVVQHSQFGHDSLGAFKRWRGNGIDEDQGIYGARMRGGKVTGHDRPEGVAQEYGLGSQSEGAHEAGDELPVAFNGVLAIDEGFGASEGRQVRHDDAHLRKLVRYAQQSVVVAPEPVDDQDGAGCRRGGHGLVRPVGNIAAVHVHIRGVRAALQG